MLKETRVVDTLKTTVLPFLQSLGRKWQSDNVAVLATSMAYYALFSLFPLLLIIFSIIGLLLGAEDSVVRQSLGMVGGEGVSEQLPQADQAQRQLLDLLRTSLSPTAAAQIESTLTQLNERGTGAGLIGFFTLLLTASGVFAALDGAFQVIWGTRGQQEPNTGIVGTARKMVLKKLLAFALVLSCALLLLISMLSGVAIGVVQALVPEVPGSALLWRGIQMAVSIGLLAGAFMLLFKYLPDVPVTWRDVWLGGVLTAILFTIFVNISSFYISRSNFEAYGAIGTVMALLVWIFLSCQVLFLGAEFTQVYATMFGSYREAGELEHEGGLERERGLDHERRVGPRTTRN